MKSIVAWLQTLRPMFIAVNGTVTSDDHGDDYKSCSIRNARGKNKVSLQKSLDKSDNFAWYRQLSRVRLESQFRIAVSWPDQIP